MTRTVFVIVLDSGGAHEPDAVYSIWTTREGAEGERRRLRAKERPDRPSRYHIAGVATDMPSDDSIDQDGHRAAGVLP